MRRPLCVFCVLYILCHVFRLMFLPSEEPSPSFEKGEVLCIVGQVDKKEYKNESFILYLKDIRQIDCLTQKEQEATSHDKTEGVICYMQTLSEQNVPKLGSYVKIKGKYQPFEHAGNEGQFDAKEYYQILNLDFSVRDSQLLNQTKQYHFLKEKLYKLREAWKKGYETYLEKEEAAFASAILLADKTGLDAQIRELFQRNGLAHLLSVSGLHITYLEMMLYQFLKKLKMPEAVRVSGSILFILLYGTMIDASGSTMRAIYMFLTYLFAKVLGRTYDMASALALAAMLLIMEQPYYLKYAGFWLSFGAVLAILIFYPFLKESYELPSKLKEKKFLLKLWDAFLLSFGIQFFTLPILLFYYYEVPFYSVFLNLVVIPVFSVALISALVGGVAAMIGIWNTGGIESAVSVIHVLAGQAVDFLCFPLRLVFGLYMAVCEGTDGFTAGRWIVGKPHMVQIVCFYVGLLLCSVFIKKEKEFMDKIKGRFVFFCMLFLTIVLCFRIRTCTEVTFLDIGQGDCCVVEEKGGMTLLFDAGSSDVSECGKYRLIPFLKANGIKQIDYAFLSHPDEDHMNAVIECLETQKETGVSIKNIVLSAYAKTDTKYEEIKTAAAKASCEISYFSKGDRICIGEGTQEEFKLECMFPSGEEGFGDTNEQSLVMKADIYGISILFTGDIGPKAEGVLKQQLKEEEACEIDILKVAHHGSRFSSDAELLSLLKPKLAIVSAGKGNSYGHPHEETLERLEEVGSKVLTTSEYGAITIEVNKGMKIYGYTK